MSERVLLAMSGGVDSSVAALRLLETGHEVVGLFMNFFAGAPRRPAGSRSCCAVEDAADARRVAAALDIPFYSADLSREFEGIRADFADAYARGRTPVPCTLCNRDVKFGRLLEMAESLGASRVATGHYARRGVDERGAPTLLRAAHPGKDQTYFLWPLSGPGLERAMFPVGELSKDEVRELATSSALLVAEKPESQDLCFVPDGDYLGYLRDEVGAGFSAGDIVDETGRVIGRHEGVETFTVGQRRGLGLAMGEPRYVTRIDAESGTVVVGPRAELGVDGLVAGGASWLGSPPPAGGFRAEVRVRHTMTAHPATVTLEAEDEFRVRFDIPVEGVAPGQAAVCYDGERVLGGGWIDRSFRS